MKFVSIGAHSRFEKSLPKMRRPNGWVILLVYDLQSDPHYWGLTQGSAKPSPWAELSYTFGVLSSSTTT
jgi:hypothetical protein